MDARTLEKKLKFMSDYKEALNAATGSKYDSNANVTCKNLSTMTCELSKKDIIDIRRALTDNYLKNLFGDEVAEQYKQDIKAHFIYPHDESSLFPYTYSSKEVVNVIYRDKKLLVPMESLYALVQEDEELLNEDDDVWGKYPKELKIWDRDGWTTVTRVIKKKRHRDMVRVKTAFGEDIVVTDNHPIIISDDVNDTISAIDGAGHQQYKCGRELEWDNAKIISLKELCADEVVTEFGNNFTAQLRRNGKLFSSPNELTLNEEVGYLVGFFIGDGHYNTNESLHYIAITQKDKSTLQKLAAIAYQYFNATPFIRKKDTGDCYVLELYSVSLYKFIKGFCKIGEYAQYKTLPENILETNKEYANGIIWGLIDSDGTIRDNHATIRITSRSGINQLCWLLKDLGYTVGTTMWEAPVGFEEQRDKGYNMNYSIWGVSFSIPDSSYVSKLSLKGTEMTPVKKGVKYQSEGWVNITDVKKISDGKFLNEQNDYIYDITTTSHSFVCNNLWVHNCASLSLYPFILKGLKPLGGTSDAPKHANSFIGGMINLIYMAASQFAGAIAVPEFLCYFDHFLRGDYGDDYYKRLDKVLYKTVDKEKVEEHPKLAKVFPRAFKSKVTLRHIIEDWCQQLIHSINEPAGARNYQSPFTNIAYFDKYYFNSIFEDFVFPDGDIPKWESTKELQKLFMKWFNKERTHEVLTFPVETANILVEDGKYKDEEMADFFAEMWAEGHSFFMYQSDSVDALASCCRLRNAVEDNVFSYTLGAGGIQTGSKAVITINLNRNVQQWYRDGMTVPLSDYIADITRRVHKYLTAWNEKLWDDKRAGMLPIFDAGFIDLDKQYLTVGM